MRIEVIHDRVTREGASPDHADVLVQADAVCRALRELGHEPSTLPVCLDLSTFQRRLEEVRPALVFNLVESVEGHGRLIHLPPALLDCLGIPYTGARTHAVYVTSNKLATKKWLSEAGVWTPHGFSVKDLEAPSSFSRKLYIIKSLWEHASIGLDEESVVVAGSPEELCRAVKRKEQELRVECFAEAFIEGREFNLSMLASSGGPQLLPPAEIRFLDYPDTKRTVVGYRAKWDENSFEYTHTVRCFDFPKEDETLLQQMRGIARTCWDLFELRGYARVDFRVDREGRPWVLEVNVNPCLSRDAGFFAAADRAGLTYPEIVDRIMQDTEIPVERFT